MISLPKELIYKISELLKDKIDVDEGYKVLSERYHDEKKSSYLSSDEEILAYASARMPATYSAIIDSCSYLKNIINVDSVTDLGSGPGTALWALKNIWTNLDKADVLEHNKKLINLNKKLCPISNVNFKQCSLLDELSYPKNDLVILSYVINEIRGFSEVLKKAWIASNKCLILVEPGTPKGFENIKKAREQLINIGAFISSPCTHNENCPLSTNDWCHFSVRLERTKFHRITKKSKLPYEDEKYCYLVATRKRIESSKSRIIKNPIKKSGLILLDVCTKDGLKRLTYSKRDKELYKLAKKSIWGDEWNFE